MNGGEIGEETHPFTRFLFPRTRGMGTRYDRMGPYPCSPKFLKSSIFWAPFSHTNSILGILRLVGLIWMRATTPCIGSCFELLENSLFPALKWLNLVPTAPPYYVFFALLAFVCP
jgi:hypothetical protein